MIKVHHLNNSKSQRILWALEELELDYDIVFHQRQPTFAAPESLKAIHPLGKAPVVEIDGHLMAESGAVVQYLVDRYGNGRLAPASDSPLYAHYLEMMHYPEGSLSPPLADALFDRMLHINNEQFSDFTQQRIASHLNYVDSLLSGHDYLVGDKFSAADIQISFSLQGAKASGALSDFNNLQQYVSRMEARRAYQKSVAKGGAFDLSFKRK